MGQADGQCIKESLVRNGIFTSGQGCYFATSTQRVSRITVTRICPGYWSSLSIFAAMPRSWRKFWPKRFLGRKRPSCKGLTVSWVTPLRACRQGDDERLVTKVREKTSWSRRVFCWKGGVPFVAYYSPFPTHASTRGIASPRASKVPPCQSARSGAH